MKVKTAVFGEALFDLIEQGDSLLRAHIGGSPFNVARSFVQQGLDTTYLSPISIDRYGQRIYDYAQQEGIKRPKHNRSSLPTSLAIVFKDDKGQPDYALYRKHVADLDISAQKLISEIPDGTRLFHTGSLALVPEMLPVLLECFEQLKTTSILISLDINMRKGVASDNNSYIAAVNKLASYADIVKVSDEDLQLLGIDLSPLEGAKKVLASLDDGIVVLTEGEKGATLINKEVCLQKDAYRPSKFVDAVGAGDTFFSAFLSKLLKELPINKTPREPELHDALNFGLMAATLNIEKTGCQPPSTQQIIDALQKRSLSKF